MDFIEILKNSLISNLNYTQINDDNEFSMLFVENNIICLIDIEVFDNEKLKEIILKNYEILKNAPTVHSFEIYQIFISKNKIEDNTKKIILDTKFDYSESNKYMINFIISIEDKLFEDYLPYKGMKDKVSNITKKCLISYFENPTMEVNVDRKENLVLNKIQPKVTIFFLILNVLVYLLMLSITKTNILSDFARDDLIKWGAVNTSGILNGEYFRFVIPMILHANSIHLMMNTLSLYLIGIFTEKIFGNKKFLLIYLFSGISGCIFSFGFHTNLGSSVGASGAVMGILGSLFYIVIIDKFKLTNSFKISIISNVVINAIFGLTRPNIDNFGHLGGFLMGFFLASLLTVKNENSSLNRKIINLVACVLLLILPLYFGIYRTV